jgi:hypothetical protein
MSKLITDDKTSKDILLRLIKQNGGVTNIKHISTGVGKQGRWVITVAWQDTLDGLTFMKALRHYDGLRYEV